jgi:hypothetical protein
MRGSLNLITMLAASLMGVRDCQLTPIRDVRGSRRRVIRDRRVSTLNSRSDIGLGCHPLAEGATYSGRAFGLVWIADGGLAR